MQRSLAIPHDSYDSRFLLNFLITIFFKNFLISFFSKKKGVQSMITNPEALVITEESQQAFIEMFKQYIRDVLG